MTVNVAIAQINSTVGDLAGNSQRIADFARRAATQGADIVLTPELSLVGYPPEDLLLRRSFYAKSDLALQALATELAALSDLHVIVGHPLTRNGANYNAASVLCNGKIIATYCKQALPNYTVFDEKRYFTPADDVCVFPSKARASRSISARTPGSPICPPRRARPVPTFCWCPMHRRIT